MTLVGAEPVEVESGGAAASSSDDFDTIDMSIFDVVVIENAATAVEHKYLRRLVVKECVICVVPATAVPDSTPLLSVNLVSKDGGVRIFTYRNAMTIVVGYPIVFNSAAATSGESNTVRAAAVYVVF